jgi:signal transduction histidine kinase
MHPSDERKQNSESSGTGDDEGAGSLPRDEGSLSFAATHPPTAPHPEVERRLVELFATLAHEFRTPLTVIDGYTSTLLRRGWELPQQERDEFLHLIQQANQRLEFLMTRLLEIAELEAGLVQLEVDLVDIPMLAREAIALAQRHVPEPLGERFTFHLECRDTHGTSTEDVPLVRGDVRCVRRVLAHLLDNAVRYSPEGGRIDVIAQPAPHARPYSAQEGHPRQPPAFLEICVCDFGLGIPEEHLERIFAHFYRVDTRLTREAYGLGLGLTICQHLVALHQGRIWAESCPEGGSAFHVWLPCEAVPTMG